MKKTGLVLQSLTSARLGAAAWVLGTLQFFISHLIVQLAWTTPYSWSLNNVSDLGNIYCGPWGDNARYVCSPLHNLMNASFIVHGLLIIAGVIMIRALWGPGCISQIARTFLVITGLALVLAGFVPADVNENVHVVLGAFPVTLIGNTGLILTGLALNKSFPGGVRLLGPVIGMIGLIATQLFFGGRYLGLGMGGMERFAVFNVQTWTLLMGCYLLARRKANDGKDDTNTTGL